MKNNYLANVENYIDDKTIIDINSQKFQRVMFLYRAALKEIELKINTIQEEMKLFSNYDPIEYIKVRIKRPESIIKKMRRRSLELTYENLYTNISDIAGIRIVCNFKKDVYNLLNIIENMQDFRILTKKDYLKNPKQSGYMSYHLITEVPVTLSSGTIYVKVEIQIRTLGMDFWANIEHKLKYKNDEISQKQSKNLVKYAKVINNIDDNMLTISNSVENKRISKMIIEVADNDDKNINPDGMTKFNM